MVRAKPSPCSSQCFCSVPRTTLACPTWGRSQIVQGYSGDHPYDLGHQDRTVLAFSHEGIVHSPTTSAHALRRPNLGSPLLRSQHYFSFIHLLVDPQNQQVCGNLLSMVSTMCIFSILHRVCISNGYHYHSLSKSTTRNKILYRC